MFLTKSLPTFRCCPLNVTAWSLLTTATGKLSVLPYGSQTDLRKKKVYKNGTSIRPNNVIIVILLRKILFSSSLIIFKVHTPPILVNQTLYLECVEYVK